MTPRPTHTHPEAKRQTAEFIAELLATWCQDGEPAANYLKDATELAERPYEDGYRLAKKLDRNGYEPDTELVEKLDELAHVSRQIVDKLVREWVVTEHVEIPFALESRVTHRRYKGEGVVTKLLHEEALLHVVFSDEGHQRGKRAAVCQFEDLQPIF